MFGHDDNQQQPAQEPDTSGALSAAMPDPIDTSAPAGPPAGFTMPTTVEPTAPPPPAASSSAPELPTPDTPAASPVPATDSTATTSDEPSTPAEQADAAPTATDSDDLVAIKQQALAQLSPLVSHLDQTPEEKFRTTMMMIQASDNKGLIKDAYEAAQAITDDKARAQALLDVINEINYFSQHEAEAPKAS